MPRIHLKSDVKAPGSTSRDLYLQEREVRLARKSAGLWVGSSRRQVNDILTVELDLRGFAGAEWSLKIVSKEERTLPDGTKEPRILIEESGTMESGTGGIEPTDYEVDTSP